jgi:hypothetical protein
MCISFVIIPGLASKFLVIEFHSTYPEIFLRTLAKPAPTCSGGTNLGARGEAVHEFNKSLQHKTNAQQLENTYARREYRTTYCCSLCCLGACEQQCYLWCGMFCAESVANTCIKQLLNDGCCTCDHAQPPNCAGVLITRVYIYAHTHASHVCVLG